MTGPLGLRAKGRVRGAFTLLEMMVVIGVMALILAVAVPSLSSILDLEQRGLARDLAENYRFLQSEATLRNVCFRIAYDLDAGGYTIEVGDPSSLVFGSPEEREDARKEEEKQIKLFDGPGLSDAMNSSATGGTTVSKDAGNGADKKFAGLTLSGFESKVEFPATTRYGFVYTPEYKDPQEPTPDDQERKPEEGPNVVYSYIFPNGDIEYTVVRIVDASSPTDGYTVEAEPSSGRVTIDPDLTQVGQSLSWLPTEAPVSQ